MITMISSQKLGVPILFLNPSKLHEFVEITKILTLCFLETGNITLLFYYNTFFSSGLDLLWNSERKAVETSGLDET